MSYAVWFFMISYNYQPFRLHSFQFVTVKVTEKPWWVFCVYFGWIISRIRFIVLLFLGTPEFCCLFQSALTEYKFEISYKITRKLCTWARPYYSKCAKSSINCAEWNIFLVEFSDISNSRVLPLPKHKNKHEQRSSKLFPIRHDCRRK